MELTSSRYKKDWRRVLATRRASVLVGIACAVVAAGVLIAAMSSYRSSVSAGNNPATVLVATQEIPKNTPGAAIASEGFFKPTQIAAKQVTAGALADAGALQGKVAAQDIYPGEQLTAADFAAGGGLTASLAPTQRAMTVSLDAEHGMIGQLHDGDHVDVYAGVDLAQNAGGVNRPVLRLLMSNVVVLQAATSNGGSLGGGGNANSTAQVTLRVDDSEAAELAFAADNGKVWLALRPGNASAPPAPALTDVQSFLSASQPIAAGGAGK